MALVVWAGVVEGAAWVPGVEVVEAVEEVAWVPMFVAGELRLPWMALLRKVHQ